MEVELAWTLVLTHWEHVTRVPLMPGLAQDNLDKAIKLSERLSDKELPGLIKACYPRDEQAAALDAMPAPDFPQVKEGWWPKENAAVPLSVQLTPQEIEYAKRMAQHTPPH